MVQTLNLTANFLKYEGDFKLTRLTSRRLCAPLVVLCYSTLLDLNVLPSALLSQTETIYA